MPRLCGSNAASKTHTSHPTSPTHRLGSCFAGTGMGGAGGAKRSGIAQTCASATILKFEFRLQSLLRILMRQAVAHSNHPDSGGIPLVSVIIPAYQAAAYIRETLESMLRQTYQNHGNPDKRWLTGHGGIRMRDCALSGSNRLHPTGKRWSECGSQRGHTSSTRRISGVS